MSTLINKITATELAVLISVIGITGAIIGAVIGAGSAMITGHLSRRADDLKHRREIGIEIGRAKFEMACEMAQRLANTTGEIVPIPPLDAHLLNGIKIMDIVSRKNISAEEIGRLLSELGDFSQAITAEIRSNQEKKKKR